MPTSEHTAQRFTEFIHARAQRAVRITYKANKLRARAVGEEAGVRIPKLLGEYSTLSEIDFGALPDRFVLKPVSLFGKQGVYLLHRRADGRYLNLMTRGILSEADIRRELDDLLGTMDPSTIAALLAEELIVGENGPGEVPYDYKFYTFDGSPELIIQLNRNDIPEGKTVKVAFFRAGFEPLPPNLVRVGEKAELDTPVRPKNWEQLIEAASRLSIHVDEPFISVDMYTTGTDAVLGELTPGPGGPYGGNLFYFLPAFDGELGGYWRRGLVRRGISIPSIRGLPPAIRRNEDGPRTLRRRESELRRLRNPSLRQSLGLLWKAAKRKLSGASAPKPPRTPATR